MSEGREKLDAALIEAHLAKDSDALVALYTKAADMAEAGGDIDACCFFLTHAYVFALEAGHKDQVRLNHRLSDYGREIRQSF